MHFPNCIVPKVEINIPHLLCVMYDDTLVLPIFYLFSTHLLYKYNHIKLMYELCPKLLAMLNTLCMLETVTSIFFA